jgi:DNA (cytosine-5)-methyltransferase 1
VEGPVIFPQFMLDLNGELLVDLFAGGGGASCGIEMATGRTVDIAINHDPAAVLLHQVNHPQTRHLVSDVFEVDPRAVCAGRPVGLLWASPDCTHFSKSRGGKPVRTKKRRALAWVVKRWAGTVRPRVICLENVEEFVTWGPLVGPPGEYRPCPRRKGRTFRKFVKDLRRLGYAVEHRELRACDYGAPTIRKRLFMVARCDGLTIVWPEASHGVGLLPYRTAAECIDWSIPMLSIFATDEEAKAWGKAHGRAKPKRPLAEATMRRLARGTMRFVVENPRPFIVPIQNASGGDVVHDSREPLRTIAASPKGGGFALAAPVLVQTGYGERAGQAPRALDISQPLGTLVGGGKHALAAAFLAQHNDGFNQGAGRDLRDPAPTALAKGGPLGVVAGFLSPFHAEKRSGEVRGSDLGEPIPAVDTSNRHAVVAAFIQSYYGQGSGSDAGAPAPTVTTKDRLGVVTVQVDGRTYAIADIAMRMLVPRELYRAQGFPDSYIIDRGADGHRLTQEEQVRMVGNSVCPPMAAALVRANAPELVARDAARPAARRRRLVAA